MKRGIMSATAVIVVLGAITTSCKKDQYANNRKAELTVVHAKDGGDDDEDPVIRGKVKKKANSQVIANAQVETMTYGTNVRVGSVYTDSLGDFAQQVTSGIYYFKVTPPGFSTPYVTDTVHVTKDIQVTIEVD